VQQANGSPAVVIEVLSTLQTTLVVQVEQLIRCVYLCVSGLVTTFETNDLGTLIHLSGGGVYMPFGHWRTTLYSGTPVH